MKLILAIIVKEFLQLRRDPRLFGIIFIAPVIQLILLGYAANLDINNINTVVYNQDKTAASRDFIEKFERSGYFTMNHYADNYDQVMNYINKGDDLWALVIPKDFEKKLQRGEQVKVQALFDGSDGNKASIAFGYVTGVVSSYSQSILVEAKNRSGMQSLAAVNINPELRVWYNPDLKTRVFMLPGIMGLLLTIITTSLMAMAIVKEREIGTLEQIIVTPIKPAQLIIGKTIPFIVVWFCRCSDRNRCYGLLVRYRNKRRLLLPDAGIFYLCTLLTGTGTFHLNSFKDTAAGYDGSNVRRSSSYEFPFRFCIPY